MAWWTFFSLLLEELLDLGELGMLKREIRETRGGLGELLWDSDELMDSIVTSTWSPIATPFGEIMDLKDSGSDPTNSLGLRGFKECLMSSPPSSDEESQPYTFGFAWAR